MICVVLIFSFLFESIFSNIIQTNSILIPLFAITSLVLIYPYFNKKNVNFILVCIILGILYDIVFINSLFINTICFGIIGGFIMLSYNFVKYNIYTANIINILIIIAYRIISYIMLLSINYISFNSYILFKGIYSSILINILYGIVLYFIIELIAKIFNKKIVE